MSLLRYLPAALFALAPTTAYADAIDFVGGSLSGVAPANFGTIAMRVAINAMPFVNGAAILAIVVAGFLAVIAQDENRIASARKVAAMSVVAIVLINVAYQFALAYITAFNFDRSASPTGGAAIVSAEVLGFISFAEVPLSIIAIITIIVYGIKAVVDFNGGDSGGGAFKKAVISVLLGILLIVIKFLVAGAVVSGDPGGIITPAVNVLFTIVSYAALTGVVVIVLSGIYLIVNLADEQRSTKAKGVIISVTAGLIFMAVIAALLTVLIDGIFG